MRTIEEVRAIAEELVGADLVDRAVEAVSPAWYLVEDAAGPVTIGGPAALAPGEEWPVGAHGVPLTFAAMVPLAALPQLPAPWARRTPWSGRTDTIRIFADLVANPHEPAPALIRPGGPGLDLAYVDAPPVPDPFPRLPDFDLLAVERDVRVRQLPELRASFVTGLTVDEFALGLGADEDFHETWEEFTDTIWHDAALEGFSKIGGAPRWTMEDPRDTEDIVSGEPTGRAIALELHSIGDVEPPNDGAYVISVPTNAIGAGYESSICWVGG